MSGETNMTCLADETDEFADRIAEVLAAFVVATEDVCQAIRIRDGKRLFEAITQLAGARSLAVELVEPSHRQQLHDT